MDVVGDAGKEEAVSYQKADTFGPKVKSIIAALSGFYKNSKREVASIINDVFNLNISVGSISNSEHRVASKCEKIYEQIK